MKFYMHPLVICDKCPLALEYLRQPDDSYLLWHCRSDCERSLQMFEVPTIELKQVATSLHPQV